MMTPPSIAIDGGRFFERLDSIEKENAALGQELLRCYEQLNLVFEITEKIATLHEPHAIRETLLQRFGGLLNAGAVGLWSRGDVTAITGFDSQGRPVPDCLETTCDFITAEIEKVRAGERVRVAEIERKTDDGEKKLHALLGALRDGGSNKVVVVLRASEDQPFDSSDMLAAESVLGYGGHILSNIVISRQLQNTAMQTVRALAAAIDAKDNYTRGHSERVGWLGRFLGEAIRLPYSELQMLAWAGLLHDIGKIGVPEAILNKPGKLTDEEFDEIKKHPQIGYDVLKPVSHFEPVLDTVLYHHENHDGSGYPTGISGHDIPLFARIVHVVDIFDALTTNRSYRAGFTLERAIGILEEDAGRVTDPELTRAFINAFRAYKDSEPDDYTKRFAHLLTNDQAAAAKAAEEAAQQKSTPSPEGDSGES